MGETEPKSKTRSADLVASITIKPLKTTDKLLTIAKFLFSFAIDLIAVLAVFYVVFYYLKLFPEYLNIPIGDNLLQILITTNGVLMGFVGIIFAQLLSSTSDQQNVLYQKILESQDNIIQSNFSEALNSLERKRIAIVLSTAFGFVSFTYSILLSLSTLARDSTLLTTDTFSVYGLFYGPLIGTVVGITMVLLALVLPGKPPIEKLALAQKSENSRKISIGRIFMKNADNTQHETQADTEKQKLKATSDRLVDLIDILFGVVVAANFTMLLGSTAFETLPPIEQLLTVQTLSILVAYAAIILSWVQYHQMIENDPYILNKFGYSRFLIDVMIVFLYTTIMYSTKIPVLYLLSFVIIFILYAAGGIIRNREYHEKVGWPILSSCFAVLFSILLGIWYLWSYLSTIYPEIAAVPIDLISATLVGAVLAFNLAYRYMRHRKGFK